MPNYMANAADLPPEGEPVAATTETITVPVEAELVVDAVDLNALLPARVRAFIYLFAVMLAPAYAIAEANANLHWGWSAGFAAWTAGVGALAVSNTPKRLSGEV